MATPLSADQVLKALKGAGLGVVEYRNWRTHNRNSHGPWGPVHGVVIHHTGPYSSQTDMVELCWTGYSGLPGPLCHGVIDRSGTVHLVGHGRANHAGLGDGRVLQAVVAERALPKERAADTDGNTVFYGFECINNGTGESWPSAQLDAMAAAAAAICKAHGWTERSVIGHKEWQPGKIDPDFNMDAFRARVAAHLKGTKPKPKPKPKPAPTPRPISVPPVTITTQPAPSSSTAEFPGTDFFRTGRSSPLIQAMGQRLVAIGCDSYDSPPGPEWNEAHRRSYAAHQIALGFRGADADGIPGLVSWNDLAVPDETGVAQPLSELSTKENYDTMPKTVADVAERVVATYMQALLGLAIASGTTNLVSLSAWQAAAVAAMPAGLSALKSALGTVVGRQGTASWLPLKHDPATPEH